MLFLFLLTYLAPKIPNNIPKNPPFCSFVSFSIALVMPFNKILESSRACSLKHLFLHLKLLKLLFQNHLLSFEFLQSIAEVAAVIPNGAKIFFVYGTGAFINVPAILINNDLKNPPDCIILDI